MKIAFLDFNGTLLDDHIEWKNAMQKTFEHFGVNPPSTHDYFIQLEKSDGDYKSVYEHFGVNADRDELNSIYVPEYRNNMDYAFLSLGVRSFLKKLRKKGFKIYLITAQPRDLVVPILERESLINKNSRSDYFNGLFFHCRDKSDKMKEVMKKNNADPEDCFMLGDTPSDMQHAKKSGVKAIGYFSDVVPVSIMKEYCDEIFITLKGVVDVL